MQKNNLRYKLKKKLIIIVVLEFIIFILYFSADKFDKLGYIRFDLDVLCSLFANLIIILAFWLADKAKTKRSVFTILTVGIIFFFIIGIIPCITFSSADEVNDDNINKEVIGIVSNTNGNELNIVNEYKNLTPDELEQTLKDNEENQVLHVNQELFNDIFYIQDYYDSEFLPEIIFDMMQDEINKHNIAFVGNVISITDEELSENKEAISLLFEAKSINEDNKVNFLLSNHINAVEKRIKAYESAKYFTFPRLIANGYCIMQNSYLKEDIDKAFNSGMEAINWFERSLQFSDNKDNIGDIYYNIATVYNNLGDSPKLELLIREKAYQMSSIYYCLAIENNAETYDLLDEYYAAMLFHKIAILCKNHDTKVFYLLKAEGLYKNITIRNDINKPTLAYTYKFLSDVCYKLENLNSSLISQPREYYNKQYLKYNEKAENYFI